MVDYLDAKYGKENPLTPTDPQQAAQVCCLSNDLRTREPSAHISQQAANACGYHPCALPRVGLQCNNRAMEVHEPMSCLMHPCVSAALHAGQRPNSAHSLHACSGHSADLLQRLARPSCLWSCSRASFRGPSSRRCALRMTSSSQRPPRRLSMACRYTCPVHENGNPVVRKWWQIFAFASIKMCVRSATVLQFRMLQYA